MRFDPEDGIAGLERHLDQLEDEAVAAGFKFDHHAARNELQAATFGKRTASTARLIVSPPARWRSRFVQADLAEPALDRLRCAPTTGRRHKAARAAPWLQRLVVEKPFDDARIRFASRPARITLPLAIPSGRSVRSRRMSNGTPSAGASSCIPPNRSG